MEQMEEALDRDPELARLVRFEVRCGQVIERRLKCREARSMRTAEETT
jgi:hypothetical protein